jgi:hypothetical protein
MIIPDPGSGGNCRKDLVTKDLIGEGMGLSAGSA